MLEETLTAYGLALSGVVPLFAALLSLPLPEGYPPLSMTPQRQRQQTLEALLTWLLAEATPQPVLFIVEDLHWIDPSTLELLTRLLDQGPVSRLLTLLTCRPEFAVPWGFRAHLTPLTLTRLPQSHVAQMIGCVAGGKALPVEVVEHIVAKTDGVPLFVEELTKMVLESGLVQEREERYELPGPLPPLAIPATLHDSLMARLDRLTTVKAVAQLGATIGRTFAYDLLQAVAPLDHPTLQHGLRQLVEAELVYQRGVPPQATYTFKHALIQDAAYQSLLRSTRQQYHQRIAQVLAAQFPETGATQPELLAHHYTEAGLHEHAVRYWHRAGQQAIERSAHVEAVAHLAKGLEIIKTLPDTPERAQRELALHITLGVPLTATQGYGSPDVAQAYTRARALCQHMGDSVQLFLALRGLWNGALLKGELHTAYTLGEQLQTLAEQQQDPALLVEAHRALGTTLYFLGKLAAAHRALKQGVALYDAHLHRSLAFRYGADPGVVCRLYAARALWLLGYPDRSLQSIHEALTMAEDLSHPFTLAFTLDAATIVHIARREVQVAQERAEAAITLSTEQGLTQWLAQGLIHRGWALAAQGQGEEGIAQMHRGVAAWRATGAELAGSWHLALLAEASGGIGQADEGLRGLAEALAVVDKTGERWWEAEMHRVEGLLQLARADAERAEACFQQALDVARLQQAKSWELRAAISLGRLWQQQGKQAEARALLAPVYGWFTEGFDTADLQDAKGLRDELGG
jgi:predicted ATPase